MKQFTLWKKQFVKQNGRSPTNEESWNAAIKLITEAQPTVKEKSVVSKRNKKISSCMLCRQCPGWALDRKTCYRYSYKKRYDNTICH